MSRPALAAFALALGLVAAIGAHAAAPDWSALAADDTVVVVTSDEDGAPRDTTIWLIALDGSAYVRTGNTRWGDNLLRKPELVLKTESGAEYPLRVEFVSEDDRVLRSKVEEAFRNKYGFSDWFISFFRGSSPKIMRLQEQAAPARSEP
jgi:hypothetical protein